MSKKLSKNSNRKRFNDDQIRSLETTFQTESRPELRLKQHLAIQLGLQPRQVAIWFQNKRARSKSKQIEGDYCLLQSNYDELTSQFEALRKENQNLLIQVQRLRKMAEQREGENDHDHDNHVILPSNENPRYIMGINGHETCGKDDYLDEEEAAVLNMVQIADASYGSPENGCSYDSCSQLWDF